MPAHQKYSPEQRKRVYEMYWEGREAGRDEKGRFKGGKNSLVAIEKETGVNRSTASKIGRMVL